MADNRMYLKCSFCNDKILIAKYLGGWSFFLPSSVPTTISSDDMENPEKLNNIIKSHLKDVEERKEDFDKFFDKHRFCDKNSSKETYFIIEYDE